MKKFFKKLLYGKLNPLFSFLLRILMDTEYAILNIIWFLKGGRKPNKAEQKEMATKVTVIFKSFERQSLAKGLYRNIRRYYPDIKIIIADDSEIPLELEDKNLEVINLPFNSGLSYGIIEALERVKTPYVIRLDDDELLTPFSNFHKHLRFLEEEKRADLVAVSFLQALRINNLEKRAESFFNQELKYAIKPLKIPNRTPIRDGYTVIGKPPNIFIARTDALRKVGYDKNIRMIDHHEFFLRASGEIVSVFDKNSFVFHRHNFLDKNYLKYRSDYHGDKKYISAKISSWLSGKLDK